LISHSVSLEKQPILSQLADQIDDEESIHHLSARQTISYSFHESIRGIDPVVKLSRLSIQFVIWKDNIFYPVYKIEITAVGD
jgi:hypothetical protein